MSFTASFPATGRYRLRAAPGGLALVQDLLNTRAITPYGADLLADLDAARAWAQAVAPEPDLTEADLPRLRRLREAVAAAVEGEPLPRALTAPATLALTPDGTVEVRAAGLAGAVLREILLAQQAGTWRRLKLCREPRCRSAFYDASRNVSAVWHDVRTCGNAANLRASRARRRSPASAPAPPPPPPSSSPSPPSSI